MAGEQMDLLVARGHTAAGRRLRQCVLSTDDVPATIPRALGHIPCRPARIGNTHSANCSPRDLSQGNVNATSLNVRGG